MNLDPLLIHHNMVESWILLFIFNSATGNIE